jgi:hypothetical protein
MRIFFSGCVLFVMAGCTGDLVDIGAGAKQDMAFSDVDMAQSQGGEMGPSTAKFYPDIQADLESLGCTNVACHGGTQVPVVKMGATAANDQGNYMNFMNDVNLGAPEQSLALTKPLTGSGVTHSGTKPFTSTTDPNYVKWLNWIKAGAPKP